jgi:hypothetical protein
MELVLVELDASVELDATECTELIGVELGGGMDLGSGRGRRMERGRDRRHEFGRRAQRRRQSLSHERGRRGRAESVPR